MRQQELTDDDGLPIGVILWRLRRALTVGAVCGLAGGMASLAARSSTVSFVEYLDTPTQLSAAGDLSTASARDTALIGSLVADRMEARLGTLEISLKEADRNGSLVKLEITLSASEGAAQRAAEAGEELLAALVAAEEPMIAPAREGVAASVQRLRARVQAIAEVPLEGGAGDRPAMALGTLLIEQYGQELALAERQLAAIHPSRMVGPLTEVPDSGGVARALGFLLGGAFAGALAGLALGWLASELRAAAAAR